MQDIMYAGCHEKKCETLLRKGGRRSRKTLVFQRRLAPFLKSRPTDAFRDILIFFRHTYRSSNIFLSNS